MMRDTVASELAVLEATIPNVQETRNTEKSTAEVNRMLQQLKIDVKGNDRGLKYLNDQVDQLEKNVCHSLSIQANQPPAPVTPQLIRTLPVQP
eukprot:11311278-Prorocentrum_lima.AAC.1